MSATYDERMASAAQALGLTTEEFKGDYIARIGLLTVEELEDQSVSKWSDFIRRYEDRFPVGKVRKAFNALCGGKGEGQAPETSGDARTEQLKALGLKIRLEDASYIVLLPLYDPNQPSDPVTTALRKRFGEKPVIAFREDGSVAQEETLRNLSDMEQGYPEVDAIQVDGKLARLWPVGKKPDTMVEEDPLFPGRPLRNGYSTVNNRNWSKIPHEVRQCCRVIVEHGDINPENREAVLRLMERAVEGTLDYAYPEAAMEFRERQKKGDLPKLKVELGSLTKPNNPFGVRRQY